MDFAGPGAGSPLLHKAIFFPLVVKLEAHKITVVMVIDHWGTYLTAEENFIRYFQRSGTDQYSARSEAEKVALKRYGLGLEISYQTEKNADGIVNRDAGNNIIDIL